MMDATGRIFWVDADRFDRKGDKSTWLEMAVGLKRLGFDTYIVTGYGKERYQPSGVDLRLEYRRALDLPFLFRVTLLFSILLLLLRRARKPDIIILHPEGLWITPFLRVAGLRNIHLDVRTVPVELVAWKKRVDRFLFWTLPMRWLSGLVASYSFITDRLRLAVEREFGKSFKSYVIWESGVNTNTFRPIARAGDQGARKEFVLFYHGTISESRGFANLIRGLAEMRKTHRERLRMVLVGSGAGVAMVADLVRTLDLAHRVVLKGPVPYEQIPLEIAGADCCICPLPDLPEWNISSPLKIFEYMACAKPIVATPIAAHRDILLGCPFVVWTAGSEPKDFSAAIERAMDEHDALKTAALDAPRIVREKHDWRSRARALGVYLSARFPSGIQRGGEAER